MSLTMALKNVSAPTFVAWHLSMPSPFFVAPTIESPTDLSTGRLSPVIIDSSTILAPSRTMPSVGMLSPALTTKTSLTFSASMLTSSSLPSRSTKAFLGCKCSNFAIAKPVFAFALTSNSFPKSTKVITETEASK